MEALAQEKFSRIENRLVDVPEGSKYVRIVLNSAPADTFQVKIKLNVDGKEYFSDEVEYTLEGAIINAVEQIAQMMEKDKDNLQQKEAREEKRFEDSTFSDITSEE